MQCSDEKKRIEFLFRLLTTQPDVEWRLVMKDESMSAEHPIHRHDFFELRFLLTEDCRALSHVDVTAPRVCHRALSLEYCARAHILSLSPDAPYFVHRLKNWGVFHSRYTAPLLDALKRWSGDGADWEEGKTECRLLLTLLCHDANTTETGGPVQTRILKLVKQLQEFYYMQDLSIARIAEKAGYSPHYIQKVFREETGMTPRQYLVRIRMEAALRLLAEHRYLMKEIASLCGFANVHYFTNTFHRYYGSPPGRYSPD